MSVQMTAPAPSDSSFAQNSSHETPPSSSQPCVMTRPFFTSTPTIARKIAEARIPDVWPRVVGDIVASYTVRLEIKTGGRLFVYLSSSVVRNEIFMQRAALKEAINRAVGSDILTTIIVK